MLYRKGIQIVKEYKVNDWVKMVNAIKLTN